MIIILVIDVIIVITVIMTEFIHCIKINNFIEDQYFNIIIIIVVIYY